MSKASRNWPQVKPCSEKLRPTSQHLWEPNLDQSISEHFTKSEVTLGNMKPDRLLVRSGGLLPARQLFSTFNCEVWKTLVQLPTRIPSLLANCFSAQWYFERAQYYCACCPWCNRAAGIHRQVANFTHLFWDAIGKKKNNNKNKTEIADTNTKQLSRRM